MKHTKQAFATICEMTTGNLSNYIARGNVIADGQEIDITHPTNAAFLEKRLKKLGKLNPNEPRKEPTQSSEEMIKLTIDAGTSLTEITRKKKIADLEKVVNETELLVLKKQKIQGEMVPTDMMFEVTKRLGNHLIYAYRDAWEGFLITMSATHRFSGEDLARYRGKMVELINQAHSLGVNNALKEIDNIANEIKETRGKGERK
jgi:hypothetical protein